MAMDDIALGTGDSNKNKLGDFDTVGTHSIITISPIITIMEFSSSINENIASTNNAIKSRPRKCQGSS